MLKLIVDAFRSYKMRKAMTSTSGGETCVACDSTRTTLLAEGAYRCDDCGYEGGDGYAAMTTANERAAIDRLSPEVRRQKAQDKLVDARRILLGAWGTMKAAKWSSVSDMVGLGGAASLGATGDGGLRKMAELNAVISEMLHAKRDIDDGLYLLYGDEVPATVGFDDHISHLWASLDLYMDNVVADLVFHLKLRRVSKDLDQFKDFADRLATKEFPAVVAQDD